MDVPRPETSNAMNVTLEMAVSQGALVLRGGTDRFIQGGITYNAAEYAPQVSDTVVITNHGQMVAHAPVEELLDGKDGIVYSRIVKGYGSPANTRLSQQAWVKLITTTSSYDSTAMQVT